ncbi:MFS transporter [Halorhodospira abdelmalekii]|uniref:MFS transporter n=1 Tax=Halorhodospira abdelmalekii TaxID=421629 RepID=UPI001904BED8
MHRPTNHLNERSPLSNDMVTGRNDIVERATHPAQSSQDRRGDRGHLDSQGDPGDPGDPNDQRATASGGTIDDAGARPVSGAALMAHALLGVPTALSLPAAYLYLVPTHLDGSGQALLVGGLILAAIRLLDTVAPWLLGYWSDRTPWRSGRRRRGWLLGSLLLLLGLLVMALAEEQTGPGLALLLLLSGVLCTLGWVLSRLSQLAWGAELTGLYHQRSRLYFTAQLLFLLTICASVALPLLIAEAGWPTIELPWLLLLGTLGAVALSGVLMATSLPGPPSDPAPERLLSSFHRLRESPTWRRVLIAHTLTTLANTLPVVLAAHLAYDVVADGRWLLPIVAAYLGCAWLGLPIGLALAQRYGKHVCWSAALIFAAAVLVWLPLLKPGDGLALVILAGLIGLTAGIDWSLPAAIQADTVDTETLRHDGARAGFQFGLWMVVSKLAMAAALLLAAGAVVLAVGPSGLMPGAAAEARETILWLAGIVPAILKLFALTQVWRLPLDATRQNQLRESIQLMRAHRAAAEAAQRVRPEQTSPRQEESEKGEAPESSTKESGDAPEQESECPTGVKESGETGQPGETGRRSGRRTGPLWLKPPPGRNTP